MGTSRTDYEWDGSALLAEQTGNNKILYLYDGTGLIGFKRNGVTYTYVYNGLGDVMEILDKDGNAVVSYLYDAWGAPISITGPMASTLGAQNPIRYRGYYYDTETGLYYLQSRYYDPVVGRFINGDGYVSTGQGILGHNMFAYCGNNPISRKDHTGLFWEEIGNFFKGIGDGIVDVAQSVGNFVSNVVQDFMDDYSYEVIELNMESAKNKYNESTVRINNQNPDAPIQVTIDAKHPDRIDSKKVNPNFSVTDSHKIKNKYEMEAILNVVISSPEYDPTVFTRSKSSYIAEWRGHNALYTIDIFGLFRSRTGGVDFNENPYPEDFLWALW